MSRISPSILSRATLAVAGLTFFAATASAAEPPALDPFAPAGQSPRDDAVPGRVELSDGSIHAGHVMLTRDKRLSIYDDRAQRQREIALASIERIECEVKREWTEKEWKFKEAASNEKIYTGREYPAREYRYTITLRDGRTITGALSAIVYVQAVQPEGDRASPSASPPKQERFLLHKRDKGPSGQDLKSLVYVKRIVLGRDALEKPKSKE